MRIPKIVQQIIIIILGSLIYAVGYYDRNCVGVLMSSMSESLNVSVADLGVLGSTYFWSYAIVQPFVGSFADLIDTSYITTSSLVFASIGSLICGVSRNYYLTCFSRFLVGLGCGCIYVPICRSFAQWFSPRMFPYAQSTIVAFGGLGGYLAQGPLGSCIGENWPIAFYIASGLSLFLGILSFFLMKGSPEGTILPNKSFLETFKQLFMNLKIAITFKDFWMIAIWKFLTPSQYSSVSSTWGATYLKQGLGYSQEKAAHFISMTSLGWTIGSPFMSVISNWVHTRKWTMFFNTVIGCASALCFFFITKAPQDWEIITLLFLFAMFSGSSLVISAIMFKEMYGKDLVGTMMGSGNFFMLIGTSIFQDITAAILDDSVKGTQSETYPLAAFRYGLWLMAAIAEFISLFFVFFAKDTYKKAMESQNYILSNEDETNILENNKI